MVWDKIISDEMRSNLTKMRVDKMRLDMITRIYPTVKNFNSYSSSGDQAWGPKKVKKKKKENQGEGKIKYNKVIKPFNNSLSDQH